MLPQLHWLGGAGLRRWREQERAGGHLTGCGGRLRTERWWSESDVGKLREVKVTSQTEDEEG